MFKHLSIIQIIIMAMDDMYHDNLKDYHFTFQGIHTTILMLWELMLSGLFLLAE